MEELQLAYILIYLNRDRSPNEWFRDLSVRLLFVFVVVVVVVAFSVVFTVTVIIDTEQHDRCAQCWPRGPLATQRTIQSAARHYSLVTAPPWLRQQPAICLQATRRYFKNTNRIVRYIWNRMSFRTWNEFVFFCLSHSQTRQTQRVDRRRQGRSATRALRAKIRCLDDHDNEH